VFVPFPAAVDDHQAANARPLEQVGSAVIIKEQNLTAAALAECLGNMLADRDGLLQRAVKARALARPEALGRITDVCLATAGSAS